MKKKVLVALLMIAVLLTLCACTVGSTSFLSKSKVNSLVKAYPNPQAELTLTYTSNSKTIEIKVTYDLLLDKAPLAVTRFVQIANEGGYDGTLVDSYNSTYKYVVMGRYGEKENADNKSQYYDFRSEDPTFAGEFKQNKYKAPKGGYSEFELYSLAMFHENSGEKFDTANGAFIMDLSNDKSTKEEETGLNSANYAVFAKFATMTVLTDGVVTLRETTSKNSQIYDKMTSLTGTTTRTVYELNGENSSSIKIVSDKITLTVKILGNYDWTKLPTIR